MRTYIGVIENGVVRLAIHDPAPRPEVSEVNEFLRDLEALSSERASPMAGYEARREALMARKADLIARIERAEATELAVPLGHGAPHLPWAESRRSVGVGLVDPVSRACHSAAGRALSAVRRRGGRQPPPNRFVLPAGDVASWMKATRLEPPGPSAAAVASDRLLDLGAADESDAPERDPARASAVVAACEAAWASIQANHPELPDAVIVLGTGVERGRLVKLGHWWDGRWLVDGEVRGEVLLAGEALHLPPTEVFEVLLHEAAHGLNAVRGVQDTSSRGRYHNARFKATAEQVGLRVEYMRNFAWAGTKLTPEAVERYAPQIAALGESMRMSRQLCRGTRVGAEGGAGVGQGEDGGERGEGSKEPKTRNGVAASCGCGRKIRVAPTVLAQGPVVCGLCEAAFVPTNAAQQSSARDGASAVVDNSFLARRRDTLAAEIIGHTEQPSAATTEPAAVQVLAPSGGVPLSVDALVAAGHVVQRAFTNEMLRTWRDAWCSDREVLLVGSSAADVGRLSQAARELLRADGVLRGPAVAVGGLELMAGDRVVVAAEGIQWPTPDQRPVEVGLVGVVDAVGADKSWVDIDFAIDGRGRFATSSLGDQRLEYGYAVSEEAVVADIEVRAVGLLPAIGAGAEVHTGAEIDL